ncbi:Hypothetical_protein [Hexamita inflata]|uniref:Hypothetical_protein n=1 Tax=Hexamita inflata TaxID=28002 RepID=A0AA86VKG5_9EUKA|nr:Hypothetical protein HINF_LOCUS56883 [Hexamita inflata]
MLLYFISILQNQCQNLTSSSQHYDQLVVCKYACKYEKYNNKQLFSTSAINQRIVFVQSVWIWCVNPSHFNCQPRFSSEQRPRPGSLSACAGKQRGSRKTGTSASSRTGQTTLNSSQRSFWSKTAFVTGRQ